MDKRYQVFVSSAYEDLKEERQEVMHALLELDCIPAGMELFPAASEDQWSVIKRVIDDCDYYVVVIAGRYGSVDPDGRSYTEKEYRYALDREKPVIAFLHRDPGSLPANRTEETDKGKERLREFRKFAEEKLCKYWTSPADLGSVVSRSLVRLIKDHPAIGWVRADLLPDEDVLTEMFNLGRKVESLEKELEAARTTPPPGSEHLAQGEAKFTIRFNFFIDWALEGQVKYERSFAATWDDIFSVVAPLMIQEVDEMSLLRALSSLAARRTISDLKADPEFHGGKPDIFRVLDEDFGTIKVQLRALGLITHSIRKRSLKDTQTYWTLTPYGDAQMVRLKAIRRSNGV